MDMKVTSIYNPKNDLVHGIDFKEIGKEHEISFKLDNYFNSILSSIANKQGKSKGEVAKQIVQIFLNRRVL